MSPLNISDYESESQPARRGRPPTSPEALLAAAEALFAESRSPQGVTMDAIAAAAGVGKATLFRAFGSRDGLLDALWVGKLAPIRAAAESALPPFGETTPPLDRAVALMDALLSFKLDNRHLIRAREIAPRLLQTEHYNWMRSHLQSRIEEAAPGASKAACAYFTFSLLATLHIDLLEEVLANGLTVETLRRAQAAHVRAVIDAASKLKA